MNHLLSLIFLISGATGLVYEVIWAKHLALFLGSSAQAHTIVLATFLGGLAIGNAIFGPLVDKVKYQLRLYGWLEIGIGIFALISPVLISFVANFYYTLATTFDEAPLIAGLIRFVSACTTLLLPAIFMGGTLPALSRFATKNLAEMEGTIAWLYFLNSAGAVIGSLIAGFVLIPTLGLNLSISLTAMINILIGLFCIALKEKEFILSSVNRANQTSENSAALEHVAVSHRLIIAAVFISGFLSLSYEIAWIRLLSLVLGSSVYSFALMLSAFIAGIAFGSLLVRFRVFPRVPTYTLFALCQFGVATAIILTLPLYERMPYVFLLLRMSLVPNDLTYALYETVKFTLCFILMLAPTTFIGMTLPLASRSYTNSVKNVGRSVGSIFASNTIGNVLGAVLAGMVLLPAFGIQTMLIAGVVINTLLGLVLLKPVISESPRGIRLIRGALLLLIIFFCVTVQPLSRAVLASGVFRQSLPEQVISFDSFKRALSRNQDIVFYKDDRDATVSVHRRDSRALTMRINGKPDAGTGKDLATQMLLGHIPLLLSNQKENVLVIGAGSGITAGAVLQHDVQHVDLVEISQAVIDASKYFKEFNHAYWQQEKLAIHVEDAKTFMNRSAKQYDVIISEPSNPWIAGIGSLFSTDFYSDAKKKLRSGGIFVQWFHTYEMNDKVLKLLLRTFLESFPHVTAWNSIGNANNGDFMLIGSLDALPLDFTRLQKTVTQPAVANDLSTIKLNTLTTLLSLQIAGDTVLREIAGRGVVNSDHFPALEYSAPKAFFLQTGSDLLYAHDERLHGGKQSELFLPRFLAMRESALNDDEFKNLLQYHSAYGRKELLKAFLGAWQRQSPDHPDQLWMGALFAKQEGQLERAQHMLLSLAEQLPTNSEVATEVEAIGLQLQQEQSSYLE